MIRATVASILILSLTPLAGCSSSEEVPAIGCEPVIGGPCEGCEEVFRGLPAELSSAGRIAPRGEPGEAMRITGTVTHADRTLAPGTIVYAYQTNTAGIYPRDESLPAEARSRHGRLRGWARAAEDGTYEFASIRPGGYPDSDMPQHVHMHVVEPGRCTYYIDDIVFTDDPRLTPEEVRQYSPGRGGPGVVTPRRDQSGMWIVERDIVLGAGIRDYPPRR